MPTRVPIRYGGTGANTSSGALTALGAAPVAAYTQANTATTIAQNAYDGANSAYERANTGTTSANDAYLQANTARNTANGAYAQANAAYAAANNAKVTVFANSGSANATTQTINFVNTSTILVTVANTAAGNANITMALIGTPYDQANTARDQANTARDTANGAYGQANGAYSQANGAYAHANIVYGQANAAYGQANTARGTANDSYAQANTARDQANTARDTSNNAYGSANLAYGQANTARSDANTTFATINTTFGTINTNVTTANTQANAARDQANTARDIANGAYGQANGAYAHANIVYAQANSARDQANNARTTANDSYGQANTARDQANTARTQANTAYGQANAAYGQANSAYDAANNRVLKAGDTMTGSLNFNFSNSNFSIQQQSNIAFIEMGGDGGAIIDMKSPYADDYDFRIQTAQGQTSFVSNNATQVVVFTGANVNFDSGGLFVDSVNDRIGIGTSSPSGKLHTYTDSSTINDTYISSDNGVRVFLTRATADGSAPIIRSRKSRGNIATPAAVSSGDRVFDLEGQAYGGSNYRTVAAVYGVTDTYTSDTNISGYLQFFTNSGSTSATERMRIDSSGNVGIGTASPATKLHVAGTIRSGATGTTGRIEVARSSDGAVLGFLYNPTGDVFAIAQGGGGSGNPIAFYTAGTEKMRLDEPGNLGLGVTPSAWGTAKALQIERAAISSYTNAQLDITQNAYYDGSAWKYIASSTATDYFQEGGRHVWRTAASGTAGNAITFTQAMTLDASGNLGVGTTSPAGRLDIRAPNATLSNESILGVYSTDSQAVDLGGSISLGGNADVRIQYGIISGRKENSTSNNRDGYLQFATFKNGVGVTEKARITAGGEVYIAGTTDQGAYNLQVNGTGVWGAGAYVNGSDARIKDDVAPIASGLNVVEKLNPVTYRYKEDWSKDQSVQTGFIAQELLTALDGQVYVDGVVQHGGAEGYYSVAYQNIIPILTKAIQEQQAMIKSLEAKVAALESK